MPEARKKPCRICRRWFRPDPRVGGRQRACRDADCQTARRQKTQASWRNRNPGYAIAWRIDQRAARAQPPEPLRLPAPLHQLPWSVAKDQFGLQGADFIGVMAALMVRTAKDQIRPYLIDPTRLPSKLPPPPQKTSSGFPHTEIRKANDATGVSPTGPALGGTCESVTRTSSTGCWRRWRRAASRHPSSWWFAKTTANATW
jgi:hypothetical protein